MGEVPSGSVLLVKMTKHDETYPCFLSPGEEFSSSPAQKETGVVSFFCAYAFFKEEHT